MATEKQPEEGDRVEVWTTDGHKVMEGVIDDVLIRPANGRPAEIVIRNDDDASDTP